jgi:choline dehydrogenase-like flavoprotein
VIESSRTLRGPLDVRADVCVIGSGAGGAVVADHLVGVGASVILLDEGGDPTPAGSELQARATRLRDHGLQATADRGLLALQGCLLGGSTAVNRGAAWRAPDTMLSTWASQRHVPLLEPASMASAYARIEADLGTPPRTDLRASASARALERGCDQLGWQTVEVPLLRRDDVGCSACGLCAWGCAGVPTARDVWLHRADVAGAVILSQTRATHIVVEAGQTTAVIGFVLVDGAVRHRVRVRTSTVVVAAGALHTPCLLQASKITDPHRQAGASLRMQPTTRLVARFDSTDDDGPGERALVQFADGLGTEPDGLIIVSGAASPGTLAADLPLRGDDLDALIRERARLRVVDIAVRDRRDGWTVPLASGRPVMRYELLPPDRRAMARGLEHAARALLAAGAGEVMTTHGVPTRIRTEDDLALLHRRHYRACDLSVISTSPAGTCAMGADPVASVVDPQGRVHGVEGLYVADASLLPEPIGLPAGHTVSALASSVARCIEAHVGTAGA